MTLTKDIEKDFKFMAFFSYSKRYKKCHLITVFSGIRKYCLQLLEKIKKIA